MLRPPCTRPVHVYPSYLLRWSTPVCPFLWLSTHVSSSGRRMVLAAVCHVDALGSWSLGASEKPICAVSAVRRYLQVRGNAPGPLFVSSDGSPLTPVVVNCWLRAFLSNLGIRGIYSSHSFRIDAATTAASAGIPDHLIKSLGRWSSNAYLLYIRTPSPVLTSIAAVLA
jgi:hypothetical protein